MKVVGIDLGSRCVKIALLEKNKIIYENKIDTADFYSNYCSNNKGDIEIDFDKINIGKFDKIVGTGYGRNNLNINNAEIILELKAHTLGAVYQTKLKNFTLIDIGGQDSKIIAVKDGKMDNIVLNDKCAASSGRYIENMANIIGMSLDEIGKHHENPVELSSTCAVFSESELIGKISEGTEIRQLAAGVNYSLYKRIKPLLMKFSTETAVITGGVANNPGILHFIKFEMDYDKVIIPKKPQLNGAIGCCVHGAELN